MGVEEGLTSGSSHEANLLELDDAFDRLAALDPGNKERIELRFLVAYM
jgi:hypothetical protein